MLGYEMDGAAPDLAANLTDLWTYTPPSAPAHQARDFVDPLEAFLVVSNATQAVQNMETDEMPPLVKAHDFLLTHALTEGANWPVDDIHGDYQVSGVLVLLEDVNQKLDIIRTNRWGLGQRWMKGVAQLRLIDEGQRSRSSKFRNWLRKSYWESKHLIEQSLIGGSSAGMLFYVARLWILKQKKQDLVQYRSLQ